MNHDIKTLNLLIPVRKVLLVLCLLKQKYWEFCNSSTLFSRSVSWWGIAWSMYFQSLCWRACLLVDCWKYSLPDPWFIWPSCSCSWLDTYEVSSSLPARWRQWQLTKPPSILLCTVEGMLVVGNQARVVGDGMFATVRTIIASLEVVPRALWIVLN